MGARRTVSKLVRSLATLTSPIALAACNQIIGNDQGYLEGQDPSAGTSTSSGTSSVTGVGPDFCLIPQPQSTRVTGSVISNFETGSPPVIQCVDPHGSWVIEYDHRGTATASVERCGTNGQGYHIVGSGPDPMWWTAVAAAFIDGQHSVDATAFGGISFVLRSDTTTPVIVKLQNLDSQPSCGNCSNTQTGGECLAGYQTVVDTRPDSTPQTILWSAVQKANWGYHFPGQDAINPAQLVSIQLAFQGTFVDVCIDDLRFIP